MYQVKADFDGAIGTDYEMLTAKVRKATDDRYTRVTFWDDGYELKGLERMVRCPMIAFELAQGLSLIHI